MRPIRILLSLRPVLSEIRPVDGSHPCPPWKQDLDGPLTVPVPLSLSILQSSSTIEFIVYERQMIRSFRLLPRLEKTSPYSIHTFSFMTWLGTRGNGRRDVFRENPEEGVTRIESKNEEFCHRIRRSER